MLSRTLLHWWKFLETLPECGPIQFSCCSFHRSALPEIFMGSENFCDRKFVHFFSSLWTSSTKFASLCTEARHSFCLGSFSQITYGSPATDNSNSHWVQNSIISWQYFAGIFSLSYGLLLEKRLCFSSNRWLRKILRSCWQVIRADSIIKFVNCIAQATEELIPVNNEMHLPFVHKEEVCKRIVKEFAIWSPSCATLSPSYVYRVWKLKCFHNKVRNATWVTKCKNCNRIWVTFLALLGEGLLRSTILTQHSAHI